MSDISITELIIIGFCSGVGGSVSGEIMRFFYKKYGHHRVKRFDHQVVAPTVKKMEDFYKRE